MRNALMLSVGLVLTGVILPSGGPSLQGNEPYVVVLGVAQDGGFPQAGCLKDCCKHAWQAVSLQRAVACLGIVDPQSGQRWLIDATPNFPQQLYALEQLLPATASPGLDGILLTHAHVGHYAGLLHLGREVLGAKEVPLYAMPRMRHFLETNGPWDQLVKLRQIRIHRMAAGQEVRLNDRVQVTPFLVPHRDEYSETVGFRIRGPSNTVIYLPDIDKWERWDVAIEDLLEDCDVAYLDGTFFSADELPGRNMDEIPHPLVVESLKRFESLPPDSRNRIRFIHLNHSNPLLDRASSATQAVESAGHQVAQQGERVGI